MNTPTAEQDAFASRLVDYAEVAARRLLQRVMWIQAFNAAFRETHAESLSAESADYALDLYYERFGYGK